VVEDIKNKIEFVAGGDPDHATPTDLYRGTAHSVREKLFKAFNRTNRYLMCDLTPLLPLKSRDRRSNVAVQAGK
jgi:hypothetical protein